MRSDLRGLAPLSGLVFLVLAVVGNLLQGSMPAMHGDPAAVVRFFEGRPTAIAVGMMLSLVSVFFLAWFVTSLRDRLSWAETGDGWLLPLVGGAGTATCALLAAGFALTSAGALRAREGGIAPDVAAVLYDGGQVLTGLAASVMMSALIAATAVSVLRSGALPRWFAWVSVALSLVGLVTPVSFLLSLVFPVWVALTAVLLLRSRRQAPVSPLDAPIIPVAR